jgi:hypothetical protein
MPVVTLTPTFMASGLVSLSSPKNAPSIAIPKSEAC